MALSTKGYADTGIIVALDSTVHDFIKIADFNGGIINTAGREFHSGILGGEKIVLVRSPMGKVNNAITAQLLISQFPIDTIYSISPAGALAENLNKGDVVIATGTYQHDFGAIKPYGFIWSMVPVPSVNDKKTYNILDAALVKTVLSAGKSFKTMNSIVGGILVSGDQFIASLDKKNWLRKKFNAAAVDMGGAAIAQVCHSNRVRCCLIRVITDMAGIEARSDFAESISASRSDIDLPRTIKFILKNLNETRTGQ
jgi:adenosylhomocysteine nucleosidase